MYGPAPERTSLFTINTAIDSGVTLIDTGGFFGVTHNQLLIGRAVEGRRKDVLLSVKFGALRHPDGRWAGVDNRPEALKAFLVQSLARLRTDYIDIYRPARMDPNVPIEETVGAISDLIKAGYVRYLGLSEVGVDTIRRAHAVHPVMDLQLEYSLITRHAEQQIFPFLTALGIGATVYGVLSRGLLTGSRPAPQGDYRATLPRFQEPNFQHNQAVVDELRQMAAGFGVTPAQLATAWVLSRRGRIVPLIGPRNVSQLRESLGTLELKLTPAQLACVGATITGEKIAGERYDEIGMAMVGDQR